MASYPALCCAVFVRSWILSVVVERCPLQPKLASGDAVVGCPHGWIREVLVRRRMLWPLPEGGRGP